MRLPLVFLFLFCLMNCFSQEAKLSPSLVLLQKTANDRDSIDVSISFKKGFAQKKFKEGRRILDDQPANISIVRIRLSDLLKWTQKEEVLFINAVHHPKEELTTGNVDYTLNKINYLHRRFPAADGSSANASIKERLFDTTDIDFKGRVFKTGLENSLTTAHASLMTTIIAGGGNSSADALGVAPGAQVTSSSFERLFPDADSVFQQTNILLQNHSYGTLVENFYGNEAVAYDAQAQSNPKLLHVFSAGNAGATNPTSGSYSGVPQMANLTGNYKQAKNILTVSATDSSNNTMLLSSRGPAYDGRVKPELVAYGEDGSSGAAALVSGVALAVQDGFKKYNALAPSSQLVKAVLINSADDVGAPEVDYLSGFGSLNAHKAVEAVVQQRYFEDVVAMNETKIFFLTLPPSVSKCKITLVWNDKEALPNAAKALVNDLDLTVKHNSGTGAWLPWVLNTAPVKDSLLLPAKRGIDTVNNVEQITIENPVAGSYSIEVKGKKITGAGQSFSIAYQLDTAAVFHWTFPTSKDPLIAATKHKLRWETTISGNAAVAYATTNGNWRSIGTVEDLKKNYIEWNLPDTNTTAVLRMTIDNRDYFSDTFVIAKSMQLQVGFQCADSFLLYWPTKGNSVFQLYELGNRYLQPFSTTSDSFTILKKMMHPSLYYSIAPLVNGIPGKRSNTINYAAEGVDCYFKSFFLQLQEGRRASFTGAIGTSYGLAAIRFQKITGTGFSTLATQLSNFSNTFSFTDTALSRGVNRFRLQIVLANGQLVNSNTVDVYYFPDTEVIIYPNPARQGQKIAVATSQAGRITLSIYNSIGVLILQKKLTELHQLFDGVFLTKGIYFVRVEGENGHSTQKLVIQ